jgi:polyphosphate kinase
LDEAITQELKEILDIQLADNVKARWLDNGLQNCYVRDDREKVRSQIDIYNYLYQKAVPAEVTVVVAESVAG